MPPWGRLCWKPASTSWWRSPSRSIWLPPIACSKPPGQRGAPAGGPSGALDPAVLALEQVATRPLFFEIHRLSQFSPRSLDVDVVLDLMIHDLDIVLSLVKAEPEDIRAAGISDPVPESGYRQRPPAISRRLRGQPHGQPRFHRAGPQTSPVSAAAIHFARSTPRQERWWFPWARITGDLRGAVARRQDGAAGAAVRIFPGFGRNPLQAEGRRPLRPAGSQSGVGHSWKIEEHSQVVARSLAAGREDVSAWSQCGPSGSPWEFRSHTDELRNTIQ